VFNKAPLTGLLYQYIVAVSVAFNVTTPGPHRETSFVTGAAVRIKIVAVAGIGLLGQSVLLLL